MRTRIAVIIMALSLDLGMGPSLVGAAAHEGELVIALPDFGN